MPPGDRLDDRPGCMAEIAAVRGVYPSVTACSNAPSKISNRISSGGVAVMGTHPEWVVLRGRPGRRCASLSVSAGVNVLALQRMLGHQSAKVTLDTYADLFDADLDAVATNLHAAYSHKIVGKLWAGEV
jgi:hypothetical protein